LALALAFPAAGAQSQARTYLSAAQKGVADVRAHWWNDNANWYNDTYNGQPPSMPLARLWSAYPLFETLVGLELAQPTPANKSALTNFADAAAKLYWNPNVKPYGGYGYYAGMDSAQANVYYVGSGWDSKLGGGTWWDTFHHHKTIEPLAAAVMIGTRLYTLDNDKWALGWAQKMLAWANAHSFNKRRGLYQRSATDDTVLDYAQGLLV